VLSTCGQKWLVKREAANTEGRGDEASTEQKQRSMEVCGLIWGIGGGPFLVQPAGGPVMGLNLEYQALHWGHRIVGLHRAWLGDVSKSNRAVQMSCSGGLHHCTIFADTTPLLIKRWIVDLGNSENTSATAPTIFEKCRWCEAIERSFERLKIDNGWTVESVGQSALEKYKKELIDSMRPNVYKSYRKYERLHSLYQQTKKHAMQGDGGQKTDMFHALEAWAMKDVDFTNKSCEDHDHLFVSMYNVYRQFRSNSELCFRLLQLFFPWRRGHICKVPLLVNGLATPVLTTGGGEDEQGTKRQLPDDYTPSVNFASEVDNFQAYLQKIDPSSPHTDDYVLLMIVAAMQDGIHLDGKDNTGVIRHASKSIKGLTTFKKIIKTDMYRRAQLRPRASDPEFDPGEDIDGFGDSLVNDIKCKFASMDIVALDSHFSSQIACLRLLGAYMQTNNPFVMLVRTCVQLRR
jgi:hypothetical protein